MSTAHPLAPLLPAWCCYQRMGYRRDYGIAHPGPTTDTLLLITPEVPETDQHQGAPEVRQLVPLGGPGFYGLMWISEAEGRAMLRARCPETPRRLIEVEEVPPTEASGAAGDGGDDDIPF